ncbi:TerC family protein [Roseomonas sp. 18066]|uniref:TerC family protein n=1 Tax=Roseomonas sp. 18066 TaxID=2681412 RepID=UPI001358D701|nr:transporter associated domain-containing protein [Roseomonas sp. 18066]
MEWIADPTAWLGLGTLIVLELVLGIDNLIFIAILADKLPPEQRHRARMIGLSLALLMRLALLAGIAWIVGLTAPLFSLAGFEITGRGLILVGGGLFLLFKATSELHERLEGAEPAADRPRVWASFWQVVAQIVVLDAVFSLDSVITAVGMVQHLSIMVIAVVIAMAVMLAASRPMMRFVSAHPTVVILCLGFLLMIGFSLIAEGLGLPIPKGYLYAAIGFSVLIEACNQLARRNQDRRANAGDRRHRTATAVLRLLGGREESSALAEPGPAEPAAREPAPVFGPAERAMVQGVMALGQRSLRSIMTPRAEVDWLEIDLPAGEQRRRILASGHSRFILARGGIEAVVGVALARDLLRDLLDHQKIDVEKSIRPPLLVPDRMGVLVLMEKLRAAPVQLAVVVDEFGGLEGIVTPTDILEAIAGGFQQGGALSPLLVAEGETAWLADGQIDLHSLDRQLGLQLAGQAGRYTTLAGFVMGRLGRLPVAGDRFQDGGLVFTVEEMVGRRPGRTRLQRVAAEAPA